MANFLEKRINNIKIRTILSFVMVMFNFLLAYGAAIYFNQSASPVIYYVGLAFTVLLLFILAIPNNEND